MKNNSKLKPADRIAGIQETTISDFWSWAYSDLMSNADRSVFAEFLVASALGVTDKPRIEWDAYDLEYKGKRIEVKCSAYLQSWNHNKLSEIRFDIAKKRSWYADTNTYSDKPIRAADCYVFCLFKEKDSDKADVLSLDQWEFYVVSTENLDKEFGDRKTTGLKGIRKICGPVLYKTLCRHIDSILK